MLTRAFRSKADRGDRRGKTGYVLQVRDTELRFVQCCSSGEMGDAFPWYNPNVAPEPVGEPLTLFDNQAKD